MPVGTLPPAVAFSHSSHSPHARTWHLCCTRCAPPNHHVYSPPTFYLFNIPRDYNFSARGALLPFALLPMRAQCAHTRPYSRVCVCSAGEEKVCRDPQNQRWSAGEPSLPPSSPHSRDPQLSAALAVALSPAHHHHLLLLLVLPLPPPLPPPPPLLLLSPLRLLLLTAAALAVL